MKNIKIKEGLNFNDPDDLAELKRRARTAIRSASMAREAADIADTQGNSDIANELRTRATELEELADNMFNAAYGDDVEGSSPGGGTDTKNSESSSEGQEGQEGKDGKEGQEGQLGKENKQGQSGKESQSSKEGQDGKDGQEGQEGKDGPNAQNDSKQSENGGIRDRISHDPNANGSNPNMQNSKSKNNQNKNSGKEQSGQQGQESGQEGGQEGKESQEGQDSQNSNNKDQKNSENQNNKNSKSKLSLNDNPPSNNSSNSNEPPIINPFADQKFQRPSSGGGGGMTPPRMPTTAELIDALSGLSGEARRGVIDGIKDILNTDFQQNLTEAKVGLADMPEDDFADKINSINDLIDKVTPLKKIDQADKIKRLSDELDDMMSKKDLKNELTQTRREEETNKLEREKEKERFDNANLPEGGINEFIKDLIYAINSQIGYKRSQRKSYAGYNIEGEAENIIFKGDVDTVRPNPELPIIDLYFDMSQSWANCREAVECGDEVVAILRKLEIQKKIKLNLCYFSSANSNGFAISRNDPILGHRTESWEAIKKNIEKTHANNVVLMTDGDMPKQCYIDTILVPGKAWLVLNLNKYYLDSWEIKDVIDNFKGERSTSIFSFGNHA